MVTPVTPSQLRAGIYRLIGQVRETGEPLEIEPWGKRLRLSPEAHGAVVSIAAPERIDGEEVAISPMVRLQLNYLHEAEALTWTRDPFDRLIAGQALAADCMLVTGDRVIRNALPANTQWDVPGQ